MMADTDKRKDLIYPKNDVMDLKNGSQFDSDSTGSPPHMGGQSNDSPPHTRGQPNGVLPSKGTPIRVDVNNGFSSEDDSDDGEMITMSQSCGQAELKKLKEKSSGTKDLLPGKYIELPTSPDLIVDERIQSTYKLFTKPTSRSLPRKVSTSVSEREYVSNQSSPSHTSSLQPSVMGNLRSVSPEIGGRIKSNPFFVQDRMSRSNLNSTDRQRLDSAPAKVSQSVSTLSSHTENKVGVSPSRSFSGNTGSPVRSGVNPVAIDIQSRIKLWAEKEREAKESKEQELERVRSPPQKSSPVKGDSAKDKSQSSQLKKLVKVLKSVESPEQDASNQATKQKKYKESKQGIHASSSSLGSPSRSRKGLRSRSSSKGSKGSSSEQTPDTSPKKSRWKLKSPLFNRKKTSASESLDSEQSDDNLLLGSEEHLATSKKGGKESPTPRVSKKGGKESPTPSASKKGGKESPTTNKISSRSSNKRKAVKKRLSSAFGLPMSRSNSDSRTLDDQTVSSSSSAADNELRQRSNSVDSKLQLKTNYRRAASQPDIKSLLVTPSAFSQSKGETAESATPDQTQKSDDASLVVIREDKGRHDQQSKHRTISRDIRDIIDSLGTGSLDREESEELMIQMTGECVEAKVNGLTEQPSLDIVIQPPTNPSSKPNSVFSDEEETFIPRGESAIPLF